MRYNGTGLHPDGFGISPVGETPHPVWVVWVVCSSAWSLYRKVALPHVRVELPVPQLLPISPCIAGHHGKEPGPSS